MLDASFYDTPPVRGAAEYRSTQMNVIARYLALVQDPTELAKLRASPVGSDLVLRDWVVYMTPPPSSRTGKGEAVGTSQPTHS